MWDNVFSTKKHVYGKNPNDFLKENISKLKKGNVLCLAEGEGRNAVFLAKSGFDVTAVDSSMVGLSKAQNLADENNVSISTVHADLNDYVFQPDEWDNIVSIFCHLPSELRKKVHKGVFTGLKKGGALLLEAYTPEQLQYGTGGPPNVDFMMTLGLLTEELTGLEFLYSQEVIRNIIEGTKHTGKGSVVQVIAEKT